MNLAHRPSKILIVGNSGSGKSTYAIRYLYGSDFRHAFIFDHQSEMALRLGVEPCYTFAECYRAMNDNHRFIIFDPVEWGDLIDAFDTFCAWAFSAGQREGRKIFVVDELQKLVDAQNVSAEYLALLDTGRRHEIDCLFIANSPNLSPRTRNQMTEIVAFRAFDERALKFVSDVGLDPDQIRALQAGSFIARDLDTGSEYRGRIF